MKVSEKEHAYSNLLSIQEKLVLRVGSPRESPTHGSICLVHKGGVPCSGSALDASGPRGPRGLPSWQQNLAALSTLYC